MLYCCLCSSRGMLLACASEVERGGGANGGAEVESRDGNSPVSRGSAGGGRGTRLCQPYSGAKISCAYLERRIAQSA